MKTVLLLGAGFSRQWGGLLASEVIDYLSTRPDIAANAFLKDILWKHRTSGGFESALTDVQIGFAREPARYEQSLRQLQAGIAALFGRMNEAFADLTTMEFHQDGRRLLRTYLAQFDAIFSLNQDLLLELHYCQHLPLIERQRWGGPQFPGMRPIPTRDYDPRPIWASSTFVPLPPADFRFEDRLQPIVKLHGSSNWFNETGGGLMIIGGEKSKAIASHAVLSRYHTLLAEHLNAGGTRLVVIGYGFRDAHINEVIVDAVARSDLRFSVIDPLATDLVKRANPSYGGAIYAPNALDDAFARGLRGASVRSLKETFGGDQLSYDQVHDFLK